MTGKPALVAVVAPQRGLVRRLAVRRGQVVAAGQVLAWLDTVSDLRPLTASEAGLVVEVALRAGALAEPGDPLVLLWRRG